MPLRTYQKLLEQFGSQGWWPLHRAPTRASRYDGKTRLTERDAFEISVGAILTQNTAWKNAERALFALHRAGKMSPEKITRTRPARLAALIRPANYQNQKAGYLQNISRYFLENGGVKRALQKPTPALRKELLSIKGVGKETADTLLLYAAQRPVFLIDAYTHRFAKQQGWRYDGTYDGLQAFFEAKLPSSVALYKEYHALIVASLKPRPRARK